CPVLRLPGRRPVPRRGRRGGGGRLGWARPGRGRWRRRGRRRDGGGGVGGLELGGADALAAAAAAAARAPPAALQALPVAGGRGGCAVARVSLGGRRGTGGGLVVHLGAEAGDDVGAAALVGLQLEQALLLGVLEHLAEGPVAVVGLVEGGLL